MPAREPVATVTGPGTAGHTATFDDATTINYALNLVTGELKQL